MDFLLHHLGTGGLLALLLLALAGTPALGEESPYDVGRRLLIEKRYEEALAEAEKILDDPELGPFGYYLKGQALHLLGRFAEAKDAFQFSAAKAKSSRDRALAQYWIGTLEFEEGNYGAARKRFADAVATDPEFPEAKASLAMAEKMIDAIRRTIRTETRLALALAALLLGYGVLGALAFRILRKRELL